MSETIIVIGGGFGGLSCAALLAKKDYEVKLIEKNNQLGGRAMLHKENGFVFDRGPSWYLMPEVFERFFAEFGKKTEDFYKLERLNPAYKLFYEHEGSISVPGYKKEVFELFENIEPGAGKKLEEYLEMAKYKYDVAMESFLYRDYSSIFDFLTPRLMIEGLKLNMFNSIGSYTKKFFSDHRLRKILEYSMVFLGGSPSNTPALYSLMSYVDLELGVWYPQGGIGKVVEAFKKVGEDEGVEFILGESVNKIQVKDSLASKIITEENEYNADMVVVNADYHHAETKLLSNEHRTYTEEYWNKKAMAPSALLFYVGLNKRLKNLEHHNLFLAKEWSKHFSEIFDHPVWPKNPSYYVGCTSKTDDSIAPKGKENLFFLIPVAPGLNDSEKVRNHYFNKIISDFENRIGQEIKDDIVVKRVISHQDFQRDYNAYKGTALGMAHTLFQTAVFRPAHQSKKVKNLFYTGHYTHPGVGVPMVVISSHVLSDKVSEHA